MNKDLIKLYFEVESELEKMSTINEKQNIELHAKFDAGKGQCRGSNIEKYRTYAAFEEKFMSNIPRDQGQQCSPHHIECYKYVLSAIENITGKNLIDRARAIKEDHEIRQILGRNT